MNQRTELLSNTLSTLRSLRTAATTVDSSIDPLIMLQHAEDMTRDVVEACFQSDDSIVSSAHLLLQSIALHYKPFKPTTRHDMHPIVNANNLSYIFGNYPDRQVEDFLLKIRERTRLSETVVSVLVSVPTTLHVGILSTGYLQLMLRTKLLQLQRQQQLRTTLLALSQNLDYASMPEEDDVETILLHDEVAESMGFTYHAAVDYLRQKFPHAVIHAVV